MSVGLDAGKKLRIEPINNNNECEFKCDEFLDLAGKSFRLRWQTSSKQNEWFAHNFPQLASSRTRHQAPAFCLILFEVVGWAKGVALEGTLPNSCLSGQVELRRGAALCCR